MTFLLVSKNMQHVNAITKIGNANKEYSIPPMPETMEPKPLPPLAIEPSVYTPNVRRYVAKAM